MMWAGWIRFRASLMAMRRTSWIDHRINDEAAMVLFLPWFGVGVFLAAAIGMMADHRHHWRRRASPSTRGDASHARIGLIVIEPDSFLAVFKTVLDRPAMAFDRDQRFDGCSCRAPSGEEGEVIICDTTTDQQAACHKPSFALLNCPASRSASSR